MATNSADTNGKIAALLRDLAAVQKSKQSGWGYKRAAAAVLGLDEPIESFLLPDGTLKKIPNVGPKSERVILEVLQSGASPTVEQKVSESGEGADIQTRRGLRSNFLSRAQVMAALQNPMLRGPTLADYHGDSRRTRSTATEVRQWMNSPQPASSAAISSAPRQTIHTDSRSRAACPWTISRNSTKRSIA